jgi:hypothetical protein
MLVDATDVGQMQIEQGDIVAGMRRLVESIFSGGGSGDFMALFTEQARQILTHIIVIIDDQQLDRLR